MTRRGVEERGGVASLLLLAVTMMEMTLSALAMLRSMLIAMNCMVAVDAAAG